MIESKSVYIKGCGDRKDIVDTNVTTPANTRPQNVYKATIYGVYGMSVSRTSTAISPKRINTVLRSINHILFPPKNTNAKLKIIKNIPVIIQCIRNIKTIPGLLAENIR
jgi:hypothetical protein